MSGIITDDSVTFWLDNLEFEGHVDSR